MQTAVVMFASMFHTPEQQLSQVIKLVIYRKFQIHSCQYGICLYSNCIFCVTMSEAGLPNKAIINLI